MRALITGARGFVGQHLARHLLACGDQILGLDNAPLGGSKPAPGASPTDSSSPKAFPVLDWDIRQPASCTLQKTIAAFAPEAIYHLAAISVPADCGSSSPSPTAFAINVQGTANALTLASSLQTAPRCLVISSAYVYAPVTAKSPFVHENSPLGPPNAYGATKLAAENLARHFANRGLPIIIARAFNHTGPGQADRMLLPEWCRKFAQGDNPVVVQCRNACLDLIDVRDVVRAYRLLLEHGHTGETYNVGGGVPRNSGDILSQLAQLAGPRRAIQELDSAPRQQPIADIYRLVAATGWQPQIDLQTTISETYAWWQQIAAARRMPLAPAA